MTLIRWQKPDVSNWPFEQLTQLRDEMNRLFESPFDGLTRNQLFNTRAPAIDLYQDRDNVIVRAEVPGMKKEDIEVSLHAGALIISGERKAEDRREEAENYRAERFFGRFQRSVALPVAVTPDKVKANYKDGILTVTLPKAEEAKPKQIEVAVN